MLFLYLKFPTEERLCRRDNEKLENELVYHRCNKGQHERFWVEKSMLV